MERIVSLLFLLFITTGINGCAATNSPNTPDISSLPIVELGQEAPTNNAYILLLRSGVNVPVTVTISGSLLSEESKVKTNVQLKRDVYLYNKWTSLDGKTWTEKNINMLIGTGFDTHGGIVNITVDEITK